MDLLHPDNRHTAFTNRNSCLCANGVAPRRVAAGSAPARWETGRVWEEAGIVPPLRHRVVAELLHRLAMGEERAVALLARALARVPCDDPRCRITDPVRLRQAARDFGIATAGRTETAIARDVADAVIDEYAPLHTLIPE
jgi:hypothetical protein